MSMSSARRRRDAHGFSLIEVMIAVLVLSIGLLGMAALQGVSLQNNRNANYRSQATNLGYELIDAMRGSRDQLPAFTTALGTWTTTCPTTMGTTAPAACLGAGVDTVGCDVARWRDRLCRELPNGRGRIVGTLGPISGTTAIGGNINIEICWADDIRNYTASANCTGTGETVFGMATDL